MGLSYTKSNIEFTFSDLSLPLSVYLNIEHSTLCSVAFVHLMLQKGYPQLLQSTLVLVDNLLKQRRHWGFDFVHGPDNIKIFLTTTTLFWGCFKYIHFCTTLSKLMLIWFLSDVVKSSYSNVRLRVTDSNSVCSGTFKNQENQFHIFPPYYLALETVFS